MPDIHALADAIRAKHLTARVTVTFGVACVYDAYGRPVARARLERGSWVVCCADRPLSTDRRHATLADALDDITTILGTSGIFPR